MKNYCHADYTGITVNPVAFKPNIFDEPPTESELKPVPYYQPNLPKNVNRTRVIFMARRTINCGVDLNGSTTTVMGVPKFWMFSKIKSQVSNKDAIAMGYKSRQEYIKKANSDFTAKLRLRKHASDYQKKILEKEFGGNFPVEVQEYILHDNMQEHYSEHQNFLDIWN